MISHWFAHLLIYVSPFTEYNLGLILVLRPRLGSRATAHQEEVTPVTRLGDSHKARPTESSITESPGIYPREHLQRLDCYKWSQFKLADAVTGVTGQHRLSSQGDTNSTYCLDYGLSSFG